jgi:hypothetical protein
VRLKLSFAINAIACIFFAAITLNPFLIAQISTDGTAVSTATAESSMQSGVGAGSATSFDASPLSTALRQLGWLSPSKQGIELSGTLTRFVGDKSDDAPIRIWAYGHQRLRIETDSQYGISSLIVRDGAAKRVPGQKAPLRMSRQSAAAAHQWMVPWLMFDRVRISYAVIDSTASTVGDESAIGYKLRPASFTEKISPLTKDTPYDSTFTIWFSAKGLPLRIDYSLPSEDNRFVSTSYSRIFKNYQRVEGILVPMVQEQYFGSQLISRITFDKAIPSDNAEDSHFILPASEKSK